MNKTLIAALLLGASFGALAEWHLIGEGGSGESKFTMFADASSRRVVGGKVRMWVLVDYQSVRPLGAIRYKSQRSLEEFDCQEENTRTSYRTLHGGTMASGDIVHTDNNPQQWEPVAPNTFSESLLRIACKKS